MWLKLRWKEIREGWCCKKITMLAEQFPSLPTVVFRT